MDNQIRVELRDFYSLLLWDPLLADRQESKGISGSFFFKCLHQLTHDSNRSGSGALLDKITQRLSELVTLMEIEVEATNSRKPNACLLPDQLPPPKVIFINQDNGLCKANALLLKTVITFDRLISNIYESYLLKSAKQKEYYKLRRHWVRQIKFVLETSFYKLRQLHKKSEE